MTEPNPSVAGTAEGYIVVCSAIENTTTTQLLTRATEAVEAGYGTIHLFINSLGGSHAAGLAANNGLRGLPIRVVTWNTGAVASAGLILYAAGEVRYAAPTSRFLLHQAAMDIPTPNAVTRLERHQLLHYLACIEETEESMAGVLLERGHFPGGRGEVLELLRVLNTHDAAWAVEKGLAHQIREPKMPLRDSAKALAPVAASGLRQ